MGSFLVILVVRYYKNRKIYRFFSNYAEKCLNFRILHDTMAVKSEMSFVWKH